MNYIGPQGGRVSRFWLCTSNCRVDKWDDRRKEVIKQGDWRMDVAFDPTNKGVTTLDARSVAWFASHEWDRLLADMGETGRRVEFQAADPRKTLHVYGHMEGWSKVSLLGIASEGGPLDGASRSSRLSQWTINPPTTALPWLALRQLIIDQKIR